MQSAAKSRNSVGGFTSSNVGPLFSFGNSFGTGVVETPAEIFRSDLPRLDNLSQWIAQLCHRCPLWVKSRHFSKSRRCPLRNVCFLNHLVSARAAWGRGQCHAI